MKLKRSADLTANSAEPLQSSLLLKLTRVEIPIAQNSRSWSSELFGIPARESLKARRIWRFPRHFRATVLVCQHFA